MVAGNDEHVLRRAQALQLLPGKWYIIAGSFQNDLYFVLVVVSAFVFYGLSWLSSRARKPRRTASCSRAWASWWW